MVSILAPADEGGQVSMPNDGKEPEDGKNSVTFSYLMVSILAPADEGGQGIQVTQSKPDDCKEPEDGKD